MRLHIQIRIDPPRKALVETGLFSGIRTVRVPRLCMLAASISAHAVFVLGIAFVSQQLALYYKDDTVEWSQYRVEPLRLHLSEPLYFRASTAGKTAEHRPEPKPAVPGKIPTALSASRRGSPSVSPDLELPPPRQAAQNGPVVLQPEFRPQSKLPVLPPLAFWARESARKQGNQIVTPGRTEAAAPTPKPAARPAAAVSNRETAIADINVAESAAQPAKPARLPLPASSTVPVGLRSAKENMPLSFDLPAGDPANVLAWAAERRDLRDVAVPRGLQNIPETGGDRSGSGTPPEAMQAANSKTAAQASGHTDSARKPHDAESHANLWAANAASNAAPKQGNAQIASSAAPASAAASPSQHSSPHVTRVQHPANGNFDVVIMQSTPREDVAEFGITLTGTPVYTAYLQVGDRKEWLLEYCVPSVTANSSGQYEISADDTAPLNPPYPAFTAIPDSILQRAIPRPILLHGILTAAGNLENVKAPDADNPIAAEILAILGEWRFRPALRNKRPVDLEFLLLVPARS